MTGGDSRESLPVTEAFVGSGPSVETRPAVPPALPEWIGPFRVLKMLGQGGMGQVLLAEQTEPFERLVAIKLIRAEKVDAHRLRRFELERQALARMSHPNIAQVFEAGTRKSGQPYLVMEFVSGKPLTRYCDDHSLSLRERLRLFIAVCEGVQHAHQKAILHRDLKPSNILVAETDEDHPRPKIIDFGIAKALDGPEQTALTADLAVLGTPYYLSPESVQNLGDPDTRSDVYALGVILYELLAGLLPFRRGSTLEVLRAIADEEVQKPSQRLQERGAEWRREAALRRGGLDPRAHRAALAKELDWVVLKAMSRDRDSRYESAGELAAEIRRYLDHLPVVAGPPSASYRMAKFVRRHRLGVAAVLVASLGLLGGFTARSIEAQRANREALRAGLEAETARQVTDFLVSLFQGVSPGSGENADVTAREILSRGAERISTGLSDQPVVRARLLSILGNVYVDLGQFEQAGSLLEEGLELRRQLYGPRGSEYGAGLRDLGEARQFEGRQEEARDLLAEAIEIAREAGDERSVANASLGLAGAQAGLGKFEEAERLYLEVVRIREASDGADHLSVAATLNNLANLYFSLNRWPEAEAAHLRAIAIKEAALGEDHFLVGQSLSNLGNVYIAQGRLEEAQDLHRRALAIKASKLAPDHFEVGASFHNLGDIAYQRGDMEEAKRNYEEGLRIFQKGLEPDHPYLAFSYFGLGNVKRELGQPKEAESFYRQALAIRRGSHSADHPVVLEVVAELSTLLRSLGREEEAKALKGPQA